MAEGDKSIFIIRLKSAIRPIETKSDLTPDIDVDLIQFISASKYCADE